MPLVSVYLFGVLGAALILFYTRWIRIDLTAVLVMLSLLMPFWRDEDGKLTGVLSVTEAASGFGSPAVLMVAGMFVLSAAMLRTGAARLIGERVLSFGGKSEWGLQLTVLGVVTAFSAFINDTTTVLIWMPMVLALCRERGYAPQRILILLAYASLLGGQGTLIGTRSNIVISDYLASRSGSGLPFFSFTPVALIVWTACIAFVFVVGRRLLPKGRPARSLAEEYEVREYLTEVMATPGAEIIGKSLGELDLHRRFEVQVLQIIRGNDHLPPSPWQRLHRDDVLIVQGAMSRITALLADSMWNLKEQMQIGDQVMRSADLVLVEALVAPGSELEGSSLEEFDFNHQYGLSVLAVARQNEPLEGRPMAERLRFGDSLLLVGHESEVERLREEPNLLVFETKPLPSIGQRKAYITIGLMLLIAVCSATRLLPPTTVIMLSAALAVLTGCVGMRAAYRSMDLQALVVVGGMIPFGLALELTGTADWIGHTVADLLSGFGTWVLFAALLLITVALTQVVENAAVAIILAPVGYSLATASGANPMAFLLGMAICASSAFMTPVAHESTILVMVPGRYKFSDYLRLGTPLALIVWLVTALVVPLLYPL